MGRQVDVYMSVHCVLLVFVVIFPSFLPFFSLFSPFFLSFPHLLHHSHILSIAMIKDLTFGETAKAQLDASPGWVSFRDQRHDLFLTQDTVRGLLTGPTGPSSKGYLTNGSVASNTAARITSGAATSFIPPEL